MNKTLLTQKLNKLALGLIVASSAFVAAILFKSI